MTCIRMSWPTTKWNRFSNLKLVRNFKAPKQSKKSQKKNSKDLNSQIFKMPLNMTKSQTKSKQLEGQGRLFSKTVTELIGVTGMN